MFELKKLHRDGIESAIQKAERYRLLNEPRQAESICLDILEVEPQSQRVLVLLLLARTDQFTKENGARMDEVRELLPRIEGEYEGHYFEGIIWERWGKAQLTRNHPGSGEHVYDALRRAMAAYERAEALRPEGNDDALLRWNACARLIARHDHVEPGRDESFHPLLE